GIYISGHPLDDFQNELKYFCNATLQHFRNLEPYINRELSLGGVISGVEHRIAKNGKGWAKFTVDDYEDSCEFMIFGEEYLKFRHFLVPSTFVHIKAYIKEGYTDKNGNKRAPRIQFNSFKQLQEVMENLSKKITI